MKKPNAYFAEFKFDIEFFNHEDDYENIQEYSSEDVPDWVKDELFEQALEKIRDNYYKNKQEYTQDVVEYEDIVFDEPEYPYDDED